MFKRERERVSKRERVSVREMVTSERSNLLSERESDQSSDKKQCFRNDGSAVGAKTSYAKHCSQLTEAENKQVIWNCLFPDDSTLP